MKQKSITFIVPALPETRVTKNNYLRHKKLFTLPYLGILMLAGATPKDYQIDLINEHIEPLDYDRIKGEIVGITVMTPMAPRSYEIASELRSRGKTVILGGMHPTYMPEEALNYADAVVCGEAESIWPKLLQDWEQGTLKRIYEKQSLIDLKNLPLPRRDLVSPQNSPYDVIQVTRGCPYQCSFCSIHNFFNNTFRTRPIDSVIEELSGLKGRLVAFVDDNIAGRHDWAKELFRRMIPLKKKWISMSSLSVAHDTELLQLAKLSGCLGFFVGMESLNEKNLAASNKHVNQALVNDYARAIKKMHNLGLGISAGTVYGFDHDTKKVFSTTLEFAKQVKLNMLQVSPLTPFPGTDLYKQFKKEGRNMEKDWSKYNFYDVVYDPKQMTCQELLDGMNWVRKNFYSWPSIIRRVGLNAPHFGVFSTIFNIYLNYAYRDNQGKGFKYPP